MYMSGTSKETYLCEACGKCSRGRHKLQRLHQYHAGFACVLGTGQWIASRRHSASLPLKPISSSKLQFRDVAWKVTMIITSTFAFVSRMSDISA